MAKNVIDQAQECARRGRYAEVVRLLEPLVPRFKDSPRFFRLLAMACLWLDDMEGASSYYRRALQLASDDCEAILGFAAVEMRRLDVRAAIDLYLRALTHTEGKRKARAALNFLKEHGDQSSLVKQVDKGAHRRFYPRVARKPWEISKKSKLIMVVTGLALALAALGGLYGRGAWDRIKKGFETRNQGRRPLPAGLSLPTEEVEGPIVFNLSSKDAQATYNRAKEHFESYRDNACRVELNRILYSNAAEGQKAKARIMMDALEDAGFENLRDIPQYRQVMGQPWLYEKCQVLWRGRVANLREGQDGASLDFLVGYDKKEELEGIISVSFNKDIDLDGGFAYEILARVRNLGGQTILEGIAYHSLAFEK